MEVAALFMRVLNTQGTVYLPYIFRGGWRELEMEKVREVIDPLVPELVEATFNNWYFYKYREEYSARRSTWFADHYRTSSLDEFVLKLSKYYSKENE